MQLNTFLQAFNRLGLTQWEGIEEDIAWGHVTSLSTDPTWRAVSLSCSDQGYDSFESGAHTISYRISL